MFITAAENQIVESYREKDRKSIAMTIRRFLLSRDERQTTGRLADRVRGGSGRVACKAAGTGGIQSSTVPSKTTQNNTIE